MILVCQSISTIPLNALAVQGSTAHHSAFQPAQLLQHCQVNSDNSGWHLCTQLMPQPPYSLYSGRKLSYTETARTESAKPPILVNKKASYISTVLVYSFTLPQNWYKVSAAAEGLLTFPPPLNPDCTLLPSPLCWTGIMGCTVQSADLTGQ